MTLKVPTRVMCNGCLNRRHSIFSRLCWALGLVVLLATAAFAGQEGKEYHEIERFRMGTLKDAFGMVGTNDTKAAITVWAKNIINVRVASEDPRLATIFETADEMATAYENREVDAVIISGHDYSKIKTRPDGVYVINKNGSFTSRYAMLVNRKSGIEDLSQLKGRTLVLYGGHSMSMAAPWVDALLAGRSMGSSQQVFNGIKRTDTASKAILQVFFRQVDACVTALDMFLTASELNPQVEKEMKPLVVSQELIPTCFFIHPQFDPQNRAAIDKAIEDLEKTPAGRQILTVFQATRLVRMPVSILDSTLALATECDRLKRSIAPAEKQPLRSQAYTPGKN